MFSFWYCADGIAVLALYHQSVYLETVGKPYADFIVRTGVNFRFALHHRCLSISKALSGIFAKPAERDGMK